MSRRAQILMALVFATGLLAGSQLTAVSRSGAGRVDGPDLERALAAHAHARALTTRFPRGEGRQLVAVVLGSSKCGASRGTELARSIRKLLDTLANIASDSQMQYTTVGVALDERPSGGLDWLASLGGFDEVMAGGRWLSVGAQTFLWSPSRNSAAIPQIVILTRTVSVAQSGIAYSDSRETGRLVGARAIQYPGDLRSLMSGH